jgi:hypothetical protein
MIRKQNNHFFRSSFALLFLMKFCLLANSTNSLAGNKYMISIDRPMWDKWGFQYPVTYIFDASNLSADIKVKRRDDQLADWKIIRHESAENFFNGVECVRLETDRGRIFVSVGFGSSNSIELEFEDTASVNFVGVARYYDNRRAAYTLSLDNWGWRAVAKPGAEWCGPADDRSDNYQAALHVCRSFHLPVSIAINTCLTGSNAMWNIMQQELDLKDFSWEPAIHARTHPGSEKAYSVHGYKWEIQGCRDDILQHLRNIPFGQHIFEHILTSGYFDEALLNTDAGEFLFVRGFNGRDNPSSTGYAAWDISRRFYGVGGLSRKAYDVVFARRNPKGRFCENDVAELNSAVDSSFKAGDVCYVMWHPDRYLNSVIHDTRPGQDGVQGSTLIQHLDHIANHKDVWYVSNGWLYSYRYVAENVSVANR